MQARRVWGFYASLRVPRWRPLVLHLARTLPLSVMLQLEGVRQDIAARSDDCLAAPFVLRDFGRRGRVRLEEVLQGRQLRVGDLPAVGRVGEALERLKLRLLLGRPDEPDQLRARLFVEAEPALTRYPHLLVGRDVRRAAVGSRRREEDVEGRSAPHRRPLVEDVEVAVLPAPDVEPDAVVLLEKNLSAEVERLLERLALAVLLHGHGVCERALGRGGHTYLTVRWRFGLALRRRRSPRVGPHADGQQQRRGHEHDCERALALLHVGPARGSHRDARDGLSVRGQFRPGRAPTLVGGGRGRLRLARGQLASLQTPLQRFQLAPELIGVRMTLFAVFAERLRDDA